MSEDFLVAAAARASDSASLGVRIASVTSEAQAMAMQACAAAVAALNAGDAEECLAAAEAALHAIPGLVLAWEYRAKALVELQLFADMLASVPIMESVGADWHEAATQAQASLQSLFQELQSYVQRTASSDHDEALTAWSDLAAADPTSLQARSAVYAEWLAQAQNMREAESAAAAAPVSSGEADSIDSCAVARKACACLRECANDACAFKAAEEYELPSEITDDGLREFLKIRRPNVPLAAFGVGGAARAEAGLEINIGIAIELLAAATPPEAELSEACEHYERAATLDGSAPRVFILWADVVTRLGSSDAASRAAAAEVYRRGVAARVWDRPEQRPVTLLRGLTASAWHDPAAFEACRRLEASFELIKAEALALLHQDQEQRHFRSYDSKALAAGDWADVGLYYNGMRNDANAKAKAPKTAALLCGDAGGFRRDCTSCSLGSAYFSLLRPHTRLAAHCGPTNARLRAHLGLVVPPGDCEIIVGGEARCWAEGKVLLFDDSFEHEVHNDTEYARLILIVDMWHPQLVTDEQRAAAMDATQNKRYLSVVERGEYETTTLRGH